MWLIKESYSHLITRREFLEITALTVGNLFFDYKFSFYPLAKEYVKFQRRARLPLLTSLPNQTVLIGLSPDNNDMDSDVSKVQNILGKSLHIRNYFASTPGWFDSLLPKIDQCIEDGKIPEISWYPKDAEGIGIDSYDLFFKIYEKQIRMGAEQLKARNVPILFRPLYEMNGPYFGWQIHNSPHDTKEFWRRLYDIYHDVPNVKFVFSPNVMANPIEDYFPGEKYLDFIALDIYPNALIDYLGLGPEDLIGPELVTLHKLAPRKPFIVGEIGSDSPEWIYNALMHIITHMPGLAAIVPYNWDKWNLLKDNEKIRMYQRLFNDNCFSQSTEAALNFTNNA